MRVLKVIAEGLTTSFRYPHFVQGVHLTFEMPPPATIYGHVCSAVGEYVDPSAARFAYHFTYEARFTDYEHLHFFGKDAKMNPFKREVLFRPRLTLYLDNLKWLPKFKQPRYPVVLGRAQDLMQYISIEEVELEERGEAFFSGTLLALKDAACIGGRSFAVTMPRYIDEQRRAEWGQYAVLPDTSKPPIYPPRDGLRFGECDLPILVDPAEKHPNPSYKTVCRGVVWHSWR